MKKFSDISVISESTKVDEPIAKQYDVIMYLIEQMLKIQISGVRDPIIASRAYISGKNELAAVIVGLFNNKELLKNINKPDFILDISDIYNTIAETNEDYLGDILQLSDVNRLTSLLEASEFFDDDNIVKKTVLKRMGELNYGKN